MNMVSLEQGIRSIKSEVIRSFPRSELKDVRYQVGIILKEMGFDSSTAHYVYRCYPYETIYASSFKNSYSKIRVAIPTIMDAAIFMYSKLRMCFQIEKESYDTRTIYRYSIGTFIPAGIGEISFFPILEHKGYSYSVENEMNDALLKMGELFKKLKNGRL